MIWAENTISNQEIFPTEKQVRFPKHFVSTIKTIFKRLFRVYAHIYHSHFTEVMKLAMGEHLNTSFKHFVFFIDQFSLVSDKEMAPLLELI